MFLCLFGLPIKCIKYYLIAFVFVYVYTSSPEKEKKKEYL